MYIQIYEYLKKILSKWQCGFRQGYCAKHCLLVMVEKWRECLDNGGASGALLTDLSKAFDHSVRWGINPLSPSKTPPSLFCQVNP